MKKYDHLPRLEHKAYIGKKYVMFDLRTYQFHKVFIKRDVTEKAIEILCNYVKKYECEILCYVFMPDHVHFIVYGKTDSSDCLTFHNVWKAEVAIAINKLYATKLNKIFQKHSYDHILRSWEHEKRRLMKKL